MAAAAAGAGAETEAENEVVLIRSFWKGPICDNLGFKQHSGECWSDAIQQFFLFADGCKEITQSKLYKEELEFSDSVKSPFQKYLTLVQRRFIHHYNYLATMDKDLQVCNFPSIVRRTLESSTESAAVLKRQISSTTSVKAARLYNTKGVGGSSDNLKEVIEGMISYFKIPIHYTWIGSEEFKMSFPTTIGAIMPCESFKSDKIKSGNHAVSIFYCDGDVYFYDNNAGSFKIDISFDDFFTQIGGVIYVRKDDIVIPLFTDLSIKEIERPNDKLTKEKKVKLNFKGLIWNYATHELDDPDIFFELNPDYEVVKYVVFNNMYRFDKNSGGSRKTRRGRRKQRRRTYKK